MALRSRLDDYGAKTLPQRHAERTQTQYACSERRWFEFCSDAGYNWRLWNETTTYQYVCWRRTTGVNSRTGEPIKAKSIGSEFSGIKACLINRGLANLREYNQYTMPRTSALLSSIARWEVTGYKRALTGKQLRRIFALLPDDYDSLVIKWAWSVIHNTIRRVDEIMPSLTREMVAGDITWTNGSFRPYLDKPYDASASYAFTRSKTNKFGQLQTAFMWCRCSTTVCALCMLRQLYRRCPWQITPRTPLLLLTTGKVFGYAASMRLLKSLCVRCGLNPNDYGMHSFRRGGLHDAQDEGLGDSLINSQAFWMNNRSRRPYERTREAIDAEKSKAVAALASSSLTVECTRSALEITTPAKDSRQRPAVQLATDRAYKAYIMGPSPQQEQPRKKRSAKRSKRNSGRKPRAKQSGGRKSRATQGKRSKGKKRKAAAPKRQTKKRRTTRGTAVDLITTRYNL